MAADKAPINIGYASTAMFFFARPSCLDFDLQSSSPASNGK
jgi:hypothetical protein